MKLGIDIVREQDHCQLIFQPQLEPEILEKVLANKYVKKVLRMK